VEQSRRETGAAEMKAVKKSSEKEAISIEKGKGRGRGIN